MEKHLDEKELCRQFSQGGSLAEKAFTKIVQAFGPALYRQIRLITKNGQHTDDVLQNVFVKVYQNLGSFKGESSLYTWMYRIARNEALNFIQKEERRSGIDLDAAVFEIKAGHDVLDGTTEETISFLLDAAMESLPEKQALVFQLKYFEELPYKEISERLGTSEGALKASFHHAKQKIEKFILERLNQ